MTETDKEEPDEKVIVLAHDDGTRRAVIARKAAHMRRARGYVVSVVSNKQHGKYVAGDWYGCPVKLVGNLLLDEVVTLHESSIPSEDQRRAALGAAAVAEAKPDEDKEKPARPARRRPTRPAESGERSS